MPSHPPTFYPCLFYNDAKAAIPWLCAAFGFEILVEYGAPDGTVAHAELSFGDGVIMLGNAKDSKGWKSPSNLSGVNQLVYTFVEKIDEHCDRAKAAGAVITMEPYNTEYGSREYAAKDLEGHGWSFGTYRPAKA